MRCVARSLALIGAVSLGLTCQMVVAQGDTQMNGASALRSLHAALKLNPAQEDGWKNYSSTVSNQGAAQARRAAAERMFPSLDAPRRMHLVQAELTAELQDLEVQSRALDAFYATLTPDQRHVFDARTLPPAASPQDR